MNFVIIILLILLLLSLIAARNSRCRFAELKQKLDHTQERVTELSSFLNRFSTGLQSEEGVAGAMHAAARHVSEQTDAESVAIYEMVEGKLQAVGVCGPYPLVHRSDPKLFTRHSLLFDTMQQEPITPGHGFIGGIAITHKNELILDASGDRRFAEFPNITAIHSVMAIPLLRESSLSGVVCAVNSQQHADHSFNQEQFDRLQLLSGQVIMVQNLVRVYTEISRRERIDQELEFARQLQMSLLPSAFPVWDQFSIDAHTRSAKEVNGDFYDFVEIDDSRLLVIIGDACGKGIPACMLTAMTRSFARCLASNFTSLTDFLKQLNQKLHRDTDAERFITLGCCLLDRRNSLVEFARAGHTDLIAYVHDHIRIVSPDGTALGILPEEFAAFDTFCMSFEPGTTLMLFSDGLSEALDKDGNEFGVERLTEVFRQSCEQEAAPKVIMNRVLNAVVNFEAEQNDDQTIILISHAGKF